MSTSRRPSPARPSAALLEVLEESRQLGFLGPGPVRDQVAHAAALAEFIGEIDGPVLDLGAGGGVPGLVLAEAWSDQSVTLLDAMHRRCVFLEAAVTNLGLAGRTTVLEGRAEELARGDATRAGFAIVVARGFGPPAVTAECAVGFLRAGGRLVVTEPPEPRSERWPDDGLARLGLQHVRTERVQSAGFVELRLTGGPAPRWPRRTGVPSKRPLW